MLIQSLTSAGWKRWTMMHGHFFGMGGFTVVDSSHVGGNPEDGSQDGEVLTIDFPAYETGFENNTTFSLPSLTRSEIKDRSKADALAKGIAFLQTTWFLIQCIARHHQRLVLTELELVTVALASLNVFTFAIWWDKPLDVKEPIRIYVQMNPIPLTPSTTGGPAASKSSLVTSPLITSTTDALASATGKTEKLNPTTHGATGDPPEVRNLMSPLPKFDYSILDSSLSEM